MQNKLLRLGSQRTEGGVHCTDRARRETSLNAAELNVKNWPKKFQNLRWLFKKKKQVQEESKKQGRLELGYGK